MVDLQEVRQQIRRKRREKNGKAGEGIDIEFDPTFGLSTTTITFNTVSTIFTCFEFK